MDRVKAFGLLKRHVDKLQCANFEAVIDDPLNNASGCSRLYRIGFDNSECKIAHYPELIPSNYVFILTHSGRLKH